MTDFDKEDKNTVDATDSTDGDMKGNSGVRSVGTPEAAPVMQPVQAPQATLRTSLQSEPVMQPVQPLQMPPVMQPAQPPQMPPVMQPVQPPQMPPLYTPYPPVGQIPYPVSFHNGQPQYQPNHPQNYPVGGPGYYVAPYPPHQPSPFPNQMPNGFAGNSSGAYQNNAAGAFHNNQPGAFPGNPTGAYPNNATGVFPGNPSGTYPTGRPPMPGSINGGAGANADQYEDLKTAPFYNEHYKKPGKGRMKGLLAPMILVGLLCSILGGAVTGAGFLFFSPASRQVTGSQQTNAGDATIRKIEIVDKTSSPVTAIAEKAGPSVVGINVEFTYNNSFFGTQDGVGQGSGIIISSDGYILTNNHVVEAASSSGTASNRSTSKGKITVILPNQKDKPYEATIVGLDVKTDIAIIKINATNLVAAEIGDSDALKVGEMAVAIGNPAGLEYMGSVTAGIISGLNREVDTGDGLMLRLIQTDAAISPGNSGGALLNSKGQVVGVNSSKIGGTSYEGLGFAIPIKDAMAIATTLMKDGFVTRPQIGVSIDNSFTADVAKTNKVPEGVLVGDVMASSSAEKAGVKAGDIITKFDGTRVISFDELEVQKNLHKPGDKVTLEVFRVPDGATSDKGEYLSLNLVLGSTADTPQ